MGNNNRNDDTEPPGRSLMVARCDDIEAVAQHCVATIFIARIAGDHENRPYATMVAMIRIVL